MYEWYGAIRKVAWFPFSIMMEHSSGKNDIPLYPSKCTAENHCITYTCLIQDDTSAKQTFCRFHVWFGACNQTLYASHVLSPLPPSPFTKGRPPIRSNGIGKVLLFQWGYLKDHKISLSRTHADTHSATALISSIHQIQLGSCHLIWI